MYWACDRSLRSPFSASIADMTPADLAPFGSQQAAQHPQTCERELQMQLIEPPHQRKVCIRHRRRFVVDAAPADAEERRLLRQRKPGVTVDHRFALGNPALPSARSKKLLPALVAPCGIETGHRYTAPRKGAAD